MRYLASHQDAATAIERATEEEARTWVAELEGRIAGTISRKPSWIEGPGYARPDVAVVAQFAVAPELQRSGIGTALALVAESTARDIGAAFLALDTSEHATDLIATYRKHGFEIVGHEQWKVTNYRSVIMSKPLRGGAGSV